MVLNTKTAVYTNHAENPEQEMHIQVAELMLVGK